LPFSGGTLIIGLYTAAEVRSLKSSPLKQRNFKYEIS